MQTLFEYLNIKTLESVQTINRLYFIYEKFIQSKFIEIQVFESRLFLNK